MLTALMTSIVLKKISINFVIPPQWADNSVIDGAKGAGCTNNAASDSTCFRLLLANSADRANTLHTIWS